MSNKIDETKISKEMEEQNSIAESELDEVAGGRAPRTLCPKCGMDLPYGAVCPKCKVGGAGSGIAY